MTPIPYQLCVEREYLWNDERVNRFEIHIPQHDGASPALKIENFPSYIRLKLGEEEVVLKSVQHNDRRFQCSVNPSIFKGKSLSGVTMEEANRSAFNVYKNSQISFFDSGWPALVLGIIGLLIDTSFAIGKASENLILFRFSDFTIGLWLGAGMVLKIIALLLLFLKGLNEAK